MKKKTVTPRLNDISLQCGLLGKPFKLSFADGTCPYFSEIAVEEKGIRMVVIRLEACLATEEGDHVVAFVLSLEDSVTLAEESVGWLLETARRSRRRLTADQTILIDGQGRLTKDGSLAVGDFWLDIVGFRCQLESGFIKSLELELVVNRYKG